MEAPVVQVSSAGKKRKTLRLSPRFTICLCSFLLSFFSLLGAKRERDQAPNKGKKKKETKRQIKVNRDQAKTNDTWKPVEWARYPDSTDRFPMSFVFSAGSKTHLAVDGWLVPLRSCLIAIKAQPEHA